jgi:ATP-dependent DNA helicase RecG
MTENQNIEYKQSWHDDYLKWVCGFANALGGKIYIGKDDNGKVVGIDNYRELLEEIPNKINNLMGIICDVNLLDENGKKYIEINVPRYTVPISLRGRFYYRSGSVKHELTGPSLNEFLLKKSGLTWDEVTEPRASLQDIDEPTVRKFIKDCAKAKRIDIEEGITVPQLLDKLHMRNEGQLKRAAIILFGKEPAKFFNSTFVKIGRFVNSDADLRFHEVVEGNLIYMKDRIEEVLNTKFFIHPIEFVGFQRYEHDEYPVPAVREMILNSLIHRNYLGVHTQLRVYNDRLMMWNDGTLPYDISEEDLKVTHMSKPRNTLIAYACFLGGYIDSWGRGTIKIIDACKANNMPAPEMRNEQGGFVTIFHKQNVQTEPQKVPDKVPDNAPDNNPALNERQKKAIEYLKEHNRIRNKDYQNINNCSRNTATNDLNKLIIMNLIVPTKTKGAGSYYELNNCTIIAQ